MVVEPDRFESLDHLGAPVAEVFQFDVGVINAVLDKVSMKVPDRGEMAAIFGSAGDLNAKALLDFLQILFQKRKGVVRFVVRTIRSEVASDDFLPVVGFVKVLQSCGHISCLAEKGAEHLRVFHGEAQRASSPHGETFDAATGLVGDATEGPVDVGDEFGDEHRLDRKFPVVGILVKGARAAVGQGHDGWWPFAGEDALVQDKDIFEAVKLVAAVSMQIVNHGVALVGIFFVARRQVEAVADFFACRFGLEGAMACIRGKRLVGRQFVDPGDGGRPCLSSGFVFRLRILGVGRGGQCPEEKDRNQFQHGRVVA